MTTIKFVTDSAADIPRALREELNIRVLPFPIAMGTKELQDGYDFTPEEFYPRLLKAPQIPTHAQLIPFVFSQCFQEAFQSGVRCLIYTAINAKGSATYQNAVQARQEFYEDYPEAKETFHIHILDSKTYTMGYGWAVVQGAKMARNGADEGEVLAYLQDWLDHVRVIFAPLDLRFAKKSGRVSAAAAFVGDALGLKPIMTFEDGDSKILSKVRGEKNVVPALLEACRKTRQEGTPYLIIRGSNEEQAARLAEESAKALGAPADMTYPVGGVVAINAGPNLIGLVYREA